MLSTYQAVLRGETLEWIADKPQNLTSKHGLPVYVTILEEKTLSGQTEQGLAMARALAQLAQVQTSFTPLDPLQWEREIREDRHLLNRDDHAD